MKICALRGQFKGSFFLAALTGRLIGILQLPQALLGAELSMAYSQLLVFTLIIFYS
jgi:hypothetical protein